MKSYLKIYGPPLLKAIKALEKVAVNMPEVCIMNTFIESSMPQFDTKEGTLSYFGMGNMSEKRCSNIISKSSEKIGDYDFVFEWFTKPNANQINMLIEKIDEILLPLDVKYTITTK